MRSLTQIKHRHEQDRWKDVVFLGAAALLIAVSVGAWTASAAGKPSKRAWTVTVIESPFEIAR